MLAIALYLLLGLNLAVGKTFPWSLLPAHLGLAVWILATLGLIALIFSEDLQDRLARAPFFKHRGWLILLVMANAAFSFLNFCHFADFGYQTPWLQWIACAAVLPWIRRDRLSLSVGLSLFLLASSIHYFPLNIARSDMLSVIRAGLEQWRMGSSPYSPLWVNGQADRMPYLPGTFLSHAGAYWLGLDLRFNELLFRALWMGWLARRAQRLAPESAWRDTAQFLILSPYLAFRHDLYFEVFCLLLCAYAFAPRLRTWLIPTLFVTRQWAWVIAPFLLLEQCRAQGWRRTFLQLTLAAGAVFVILLALFHSTTSLHEFTDAVFVFQERLRLPNYPGDFGLTFAPLFYLGQAAGWTQPLQAMFVLGCLVYALWQTREDPIRLSVIAWIGFLVLNYHFWIYFWISPIVWVVAQGVASITHPRDLKYVR